MKPDGIARVFTCTACPVQAHGTVDGVPFYFRARYQWWTMEIGPGNTHRRVDKEAADDDPYWEYEERWSDEEFAAGYMSLDEADGCMAKAAALWRAEGRPLEAS